jgi:hypothetical protein
MLHIPVEACCSGMETTASSKTIAPACPKRNPNPARSPNQPGCHETCQVFDPQVTRPCVCYPLNFNKVAENTKFKDGFLGGWQ